MIDALAYAVVALAGIAVVWGLVSAIATKPPGKAQLLYAAGLEVEERVGRRQQGSSR